MDHLVRQWNYLPDILRTTTENGRLYQNYQLFNDIRQYYYGIYKRSTVYPSATGIGMDCESVSIDFFAVQLHDSIRLVGLNNPNQTAVTIENISALTSEKGTYFRVYVKQMFAGIIY
jgi:hypothetical protein